MDREIIDIYSKGEYPADVLSNFYPHGFVFDGVECASMEGLLQSLKMRSTKKQITCPARKPSLFSAADSII